MNQYKYMDTKHIRIDDYNYGLPDERIAKFPLKERDHSKLLVYNKGKLSDDVFFNLPQYLPKGALMVFNNTRVIQARMHFRKETGALIEVFLMEPALPADYEQMFQSTSHCSWLCMIGNLKKWKDGSLKRDFEIKGHKLTLSATMDRSKAIEKSGGTNYWVDFEWDAAEVNFAEILDAVGELPIPPYLNRKTEESDKTTYQTVYSKIKGSVAAPTAGLHFTDKVLADIDAHGITRDEVTLHVGAGTFKPVKTEEIEGHKMHSEYIVVHRHTFERLLQYDGKAIAVGTTSVRTLESLYYVGVKILRNPNATEEELSVNQWEPYDLPHDDAGLVIVDGKPVQVCDSIKAILDYLDRDGLEALHTATRIIIAPGYVYKVVKMLVTNFHQPKSTLLLLVSAFLKGDWRAAYDYALDHGFRFLSYGDSNLLIP
jgi:S-adenosylmethionine:tRNA ribosyltransferase-isomerase